MKAGAYHVAAGDLHRPEDAAKIIGPAKKALEKIAKKRKLVGALERLVELHPRKVVENAPPEEIPAV